MLLLFIYCDTVFFNILLTNRHFVATLELHNGHVCLSVALFDVLQLSVYLSSKIGMIPTTTSIPHGPFIHARIICDMPWF